VIKIIIKHCDFLATTTTWSSYVDITGYVLLLAKSMCGCGQITEVATAKL